MIDALEAEPALKQIPDDLFDQDDPFDDLARMLSDALLAAYLLALDHASAETGVTSFAEGDPIQLGFDVTPEEAVKYFRRKRIVSRKEFDLLSEDARAAAFTVSGVTRDDVLKGFRDEIAKALKEGTAQSKVIKRFREILDGAGYRQLGAKHFETVVRTNLMMSYQTGRRRALESVADDLPYWEYLTAGDDRVRPTHAALHGVILPANHPFWNDHFPPWSYNCRCTARPVDSIPEGYNPAKPDPEGDATLFYDDQGNPAKAEIGTSVYDLAAAGNFQGVPPQGGLRQVIERGIERARQRAAQPDTQPLGSALTLNKQTEFVRPVISTIESVHEISRGMPVTNVIRTTSLKIPGQYNSEENRILINNRLPNWELTLAHEIGHLIDRKGIGAANLYASEKSRLMSEWRRAYRNSQAFKELQKLLQNPVIRIPGRITRIIHVDTSYIQYLLRPAEGFGRSYAQFIAARSKQEALLKSIDSIRYDLGSVYRFQQWGDKDFEPIAEAIEKLFARMGWLK